MMKSLFIWLRIEILRFVREPISLFFSLIFPIILIYIFGDSFGSGISEDGISYYNSLVAIDVSFLIVNFTLMGVGNDVANQKENGIEESMAMLPVSGIFRTVIQSIAYLLLLFLSLVMLTAFVFNVYPDVRFQGNAFLFVLFMIFGYFLFVNLAKFLAAFPFSARTLQLINSTVFFILLFCSGIVIQKESMPEGLRPMVDWSPLYILYKTLESVWNNRLTDGQYLRASAYLLVLGAMCYLAATLLGARSRRRQRG